MSEQIGVPVFLLAEVVCPNRSACICLWNADYVARRNDGRRRTGRTGRTWTDGVDWTDGADVDDGRGRDVKKTFKNKNALANDKNVIE